MMRALIFLLAAISLSGCFACEEAEKNGPRDLLMVSKFNQLFEEHAEKIGEHRGIGEGKYWESKGLIYGRYIVVLSFKVKVARDCSLSRESKPTIRVMEYYDFTRKSEGRGNARGRMVGELLEKEFMSLESGDEIFALIDIIPIRDKPIDGLKDVLSFW